LQKDNNLIERGKRRGFEIERYWIFFYAEMYRDLIDAGLHFDRECVGKPNHRCYAALRH
jgi:hypothetical protein